MPTVVVFDCESDGKPIRTGLHGEPDFTHVQCTVVCALVFDAKCLATPESAAESLAAARKIICWRDVVPHESVGPFDELFTAFDRADLIVGYNQLDFDFPLLRKYYGRSWSVDKYVSHRIKCLDVFQRVRCVLGYWPKLEYLLHVNGLAGKSGTGAEAITMWNDGRRKELQEYCEIDVLRTAQLALLPEMRIDARYTIPSFVYGIIPALATHTSPTS